MAGNFSGPTIDQLRNADPSQTFVERRGGGFIVSWPEGSPEFRSTFRALPRGPRTAAEYQRRLEAIEAETDAISWS